MSCFTQKGSSCRNGELLPDYSTVILYASTIEAALLKY
ncbi:hypothetical protein KNP414_03124 [Paenibacillus mucilaginosus KNP414]|uniref:Uncharacterized protein n=1 Tax=Paenibacillus mucilaginosus (strain KNP414) TaxID=1036673 RepID=F8FB39_PAEMK|nr:hypothetical protein KNP414_03124 [Paenibacillus mucilaginosus KNP414]